MSPLSTTVSRPSKDDKPVVSQHRLALGDETIEYTATAGTLTLNDDDGKARARMFHVAHTRDGVKDAAARPVTFTFNGGPGSSSVWRHMGAFGPLRVTLPDDAAPPAPSYTLAENPWSLLDVTDLVFIDPVSTGYSRAVADQGAQQFHGVTADVESVGEFSLDSDLPNVLCGARS